MKLKVKKFMAEKEKRKKETVKKAQALAKKAVNKGEAITDTVRGKADAVKGFTVQTAQKAGHSVKGVQGKTSNVKKDIKAGYHEISQDTHNAAENISADIRSR